MKYCNKCFLEQNECRCPNNSVYYGKDNIQNNFIDIDYLIYPTIYELNRKGYQTIFCCSCHPESTLLNPYIKLGKNDYNIECKELLFSFETYRYKGIEKEKKEFIRPTKDSIKEYSKLKGIEDRMNYLIDFNRKLYYWSKSLPVFIENKNIKTKEFSDEYFEQFKEQKQVIPFLLVINANKPEWQTYLNIIFGESHRVSTTGISNDAIYDKILIDLNRYNDQTIKMLSNTCNTLVISNKISANSIKVHLFEKQWNIYSIDKEIARYDIQQEMNFANVNYYSGKSILDSLITAVKNSSVLCDCGTLLCSDGQLNIIITTKDQSFYMYQFEDSLLITNSEEIASKNEFGSFKLEAQTYLVFTNEKLLIKGVVNNGSLLSC